MINNYLAAAIHAVTECDTDSIYIHKADVIDNETDDTQLLLIEFSIEEEEDASLPGRPKKVVKE